MRTLVAIPMKDARDSKTRLANALSDAERERLARSLFVRSQSFFATYFPHFSRLVVTPSEQMGQLASEAGAQVLKEAAATGLNQAAGAAFHWARRNGFDRLLIVPADIPVWLQHEVHALLQHGDSVDVAIARAHDGGTNGLLIHLARVAQFEFRYGSGSAQEHAQFCREAGMRSVVCHLPFIGRDIDTADDCLVMGESQCTRSRP